MIIQIVLIAALIGFSLYALSQRRRAAPLANAMMAISLLGILLVLFPALTSDVAHAVGVGRGTDLVLYCFILITIMAIGNIHLRLRAASEQTTELARAVALLSAQPPLEHRSDVDAVGPA